MSAAVFTTITGEDWRRNLPKARARRAQQAVAMESIRERARRASLNTLTGAPADGAQGDPATALNQTTGISGP